MNSIIKELFEKKLYEIATRLNVDIAYDNISFNPQGIIYLKSHLLPAKTTTFDLAQTTRVFEGIYQVSIVVPVNTGLSKANSIVSDIISSFQINTELIKDNFIVYVNSVPSAYSAIQDKTTYTIPISINYRADI